MYHYTSCGLHNIWLANGYNTRNTPYGKAVSIDNLTGLHQLIGMELVEYKPRLSGGEFRFLRKELDFSQARLASILGSTSQSIAGWEKSGCVPKWADRFIRALYRECANGNAHIIELVEKLNDADRKHIGRKWTFEDTDTGWRTKAA